MKDALAEKLLARIMKWTSEVIFEEIPQLQSLASFKYNEYQQFSTGMRFIESLVRWLQQFQTVEERKIAYGFLKQYLIFISSDQMSYLVNMVFSDKINPILIKKTAQESSGNKYCVSKIINSKEYKRILRKSLFIGLSDGSRIDQLRRSNGLDNEQVCTTYDISPEKAKDLSKELHKECKNCKFDSIFLIDDFTGSGKSNFRLEKGKEKGKILKFLHYIYNGENLDDLIDKENLYIHILFYLATQHSIKTIEDNISTWKNTHNISFNHSVQAIQILGDTIKSSIAKDREFMELIKNENYFDETIIDSHYEKGKCDKPYLGFDECSLPLVLSHNTPNNSLAILWLPDDKKFQGLFPRVTRHRDEW
ncbi:hypothetical protein ES705_13563 [subsurface metagenome]